MESDIDLEQLTIDEITSPHPFKGEDKYTLFFFVKVGILTVVFALLWIILFPLESSSYNDHTNTSETPGKQSTREKDTSASVDEVDSYIQTIVNTLLSKDHHAAPSYRNAQKRFHQICTRYSTICTKTTWQGSFSASDKLIYQAIIIQLVKVVNNYLATDIEDRMDYFKIIQSSSAMERRGSATDYYIKMNTALIDLPNEFWQVLTHELGHMIDFRVIEGSGGMKDKTYTEFGKARWYQDDPSLDFYKISRLDERTRRGSATYKNFVSGYGMRGMYEDFAEAHNLRLNHNSYFQDLAASNTDLAKKYHYFDDVYKGKTYRILGDDYPHTSERVRDTTKL